MPPRSPTIVGSAVDTIVWSSDASRSVSSSAPKIRRTRWGSGASPGCGMLASAALTPLLLGWGPTELGPSGLEPPELSRQLSTERGERLAALPDELHLALHEGDRRLDDPQPLGV